MIEVNSLFAVFVVEGLAALILLVVVVAFSMSRRNSNERSAVKDFVNKLKKGEKSRKEELSVRLSETCQLEDSALHDALAEIGVNEKQLYQHIVKMVLRRDPTLLAEIDKGVQVLSEPFCKLLAKLSTIEKADPAMNALTEKTNSEIQQLRSERERLSKQLSMAMETMDEVSNEYSKMFGSAKQAEELDFSRKRMLNTYKRAEEQMKEALMEGPTEELEMDETTEELDIEEF